MFPYHYMIDRNGQTVRYNDLDINVWGTMNNYINQRAIQIALVWNFMVEKPTEAQYAELNRVIAKLMTLNHKTKIQIIWHKEASPTSCPWINFDFSRVRQLPAIIPNIHWAPIVAPKSAKVITFHLSRYYSPVPNQTRYYGNKDYLSDVKMNCGLNKDGTPSDCLHTANWHQLVMSDKNQSVACDKSMLGKKIYLDWVGVVTCNDVWWAIKGNRLDMRCGIWDKALDEWTECKTGIKNGYLLD